MSRSPPLSTAPSVHSRDSRANSEFTTVQSDGGDVERLQETEPKGKLTATSKEAASGSSSDISSETQHDGHIPATKKRFGLFPVPPQSDPGPPPDGGLTAWLQVLAGALIGVVTWGLITTFGVFQTDYVERLQASPSAVSWIGTIQTFLLLFLGAFSGRASDAGLAHEAVLLGSFLIVFGLFMTSLAQTYWQVFLSQGVCVGLGMGTLYMPGLSVPSTYFKKNKSIAAGLMAAGNGIGGVIFPGMYEGLLPKIGLAWTIRCMAFVVLAICIIFNLILRVRVPPRSSGPLIDLEAFRQPSYSFYAVAFFLVYWAIYFAFYYIDAFGHTYASFTLVDSTNILLITNALGIPGRIIPGIVASRWLGPVNTVIPLAFITSIVLYSWTGLLAHPTHSSVYGYAAVYGLVGSALQASFSISLASITEDLTKLGTRMGMVFAVVSFAALTGGPIAGALIERQGGYLAPILWAGSSVMLAMCFFIAARIAHTGMVWRARI